MNTTFESNPLAREIGAEQCLCCKHYRIAKYPRSCDAFPEKIPREIILGNHDHCEPFEGDSGILFEPLTKEQMDERARQIRADLVKRKTRTAELAIAK